MKKNAPNAYNNSRARSSSAGSRTPRINGTKGSSSSSVTRSAPKPQAATGVTSKLEKTRFAALRFSSLNSHSSNLFRNLRLLLSLVLISR